MKEIIKTIYKFAFEDINNDEIFLLSKEDSKKIWEDNIDKKHNHYFKLNDENWLINKEKNIIDQNYINDFNEEFSGRITSLLDNLNWNEDDKIYFCINSDIVIYCSWKVLKNSWINFLYVYDDSPIILRINNNNKEALIFESNGLIYQIFDTII